MKCLLRLCPCFRSALMLRLTYICVHTPLHAHLVFNHGVDKSLSIGCSSFRRVSCGLTIFAMGPQDSIACTIALANIKTLHVPGRHNGLHAAAVLC